MPRLGWTNPRLIATQHPTVQDVAWAAGIYEGEGCACARAARSNTNHRPAIVKVGQKDRWLLERLQSLFGGSITEAYQTGSYRTISYWNISGARARGFLMTIYKFLSPRRQEKIREVLAIG